MRFSPGGCNPRDNARQSKHFASSRRRPPSTGYAAHPGRRKKHNIPVLTARCLAPCLELTPPWCPPHAIMQTTYGDDECCRALRGRRQVHLEISLTHSLTHLPKDLTHACRHVSRPRSPVALVGLLLNRPLRRFRCLLLGLGPVPGRDDAAWA